MRLQAKFGETEARKIAAREARERRAAAELEKLEKDADPNLIPLGARAGIKGGRAGESAARAAAEAALALDAIPDVEWWDAAILATGSYDDVAGGKWNVKPEKISLYVEHPVPMQPPTEAPPPPPQPLKLTKREQKKLRTQRRMAREQEKQEMIKQGLLEPPKPKVKISNLMRVLTDEATADPTAVEREVREQMAERQSAAMRRPRLDRALARACVAMCVLGASDARSRPLASVVRDIDPSDGIHVRVPLLLSLRVHRARGSVQRDRQSDHSHRRRLGGVAAVQVRVVHLFVQVHADSFGELH